MKTLKIMVCALFVVCGGLFLSACGEKNKDFDVSKITVNNFTEYTYDGNPHTVTVSYEGVKANVTYALEDNKNNFKSLRDLGIVDVGTYKMYYKLSAKGYNDYVSSGTLELTIVPKTLRVSLGDVTLMKSELNNIYSFAYTVDGTIVGDNTGLSYSLGETFDPATVNYGDVFDITWSITNPNYVLEADQAKAYIKDYVQINGADGAFKAYYPDIQTAINNAENGETIVLNNNIVADEVIDVNKSVTIDGQNLYNITARSSFKNTSYAGIPVASVFNVTNSNVELTLKDVVVDGGKVARGVSAFHGKVCVDGATITNGKKNDGWRSGGVYITNDAGFSMTGGLISGNNANDTEYTKYCADLWVGANVKGSLISVTGGEIGSVFVNSNSYSAVGAGMFLFNGGKIGDVYVEYYSGYGAQFKYVDGEITNLYVALKNDNGDYYGVAHKLTPVQETTYIGGQLVYETSSSTYFADETYNTNVGSNFVDGLTYVFENCVFNAPINATKRVGLVFNNCRFNTTQVGSILNINSVESLIVNNCTFEGNTTGGYAIDVNLYSTSCDDIVIANNVFNTSTDTNGAIAVRTRLGVTDHPSESWAQGQVAGYINGEVSIVGNDFNDDNTLIEIGALYQTHNSTANTSTGDFDVVVMENKDSVTIYNLFKVYPNMDEEEYEERGVKVTIQPNGVYEG